MLKAFRGAKKMFRRTWWVRLIRLQEISALRKGLKFRAQIRFES